MKRPTKAIPILLAIVLLAAALVAPLAAQSEQNPDDLIFISGTIDLTQGGITGRIAKVGENYLSLEVAEGKDGPVVITVQKNAVGALLPKGTLKNL